MRSGAFAAFASSMDELSLLKILSGRGVDLPMKAMVDDVWR
jgi:hypothetical protein